MPSLTVDAGDGRTLNVPIPPGTPPSQYGAMADDARAGYEAMKVNPVEAAMKGAVNNLPLGGQLGAEYNTVAKGEPYESALPDWLKGVAQAKEQHPIAYGAGAVAGSVAPFAVPGVGEAAEASPVVTNALLGAGNALSDTNLQNTNEVAANALTGAAIGGGLGAVADKLMPEEGALENKANLMTARGAGIRPGIVGGMETPERTQIGAFLHQNGLDTGDLDAKVVKTNALVDQYGKQIEELGKTASPVAKPQSYLQSLLDKMNELKDSPLAEDKRDARQLAQGIDAIAQKIKPEGISFSDLMTLKKKFGEKAFDAIHQVKSQPFADLYSALKKMQTDAVAQGKPELQNAFQKYSWLKDVSDAFERQRGMVESQAAGKVRSPFSALATLPRPWNFGVAGAGIAAGHTYLGLYPIMGEALNPENQAAALRILGKTAPKMLMGGSNLLSNLLTQPQSFGKYAQPLLQAAQTGGPKAVAAQHFLLSQRDPEYNDKLKEMQNDASANP